MPDLAYLKSVLQYDAESGDLIWMRKKYPHRNGTLAGNKMPNGYRVVEVLGVRYLTHRIAFFMHFGIDPLESEIDHKDLNRSNSAASNLRMATRSGNSANKGLRRDNSSGHKGVSFNKCKNLWQAKISNRHLGYFACLQQASYAYNEAAKSEFGEYSRINVLGESE